MGKHKVEYAQRSHTHRYVVLVFVSRPFIFHFTKVPPPSSGWSFATLVPAMITTPIVSRFAPSHVVDILAATLWYH